MLERLRRSAGTVADLQSRARAIFDARYYLDQYPDVAQGDIDPFEHFLSVGWAEGRNPSVLFDTNWYFETYPDVLNEGVNPLLHYVDTGWSEGRQPHPLFDVKWYFSQNPDIAEAGIEPLAHYQSNGWKEGRSPHPLFDLRWYCRRYSDVANSKTEPLKHYIKNGGREGRRPHPVFDPKRYRQLASISKDENPLEHFLVKGAKRGLSPHALFDLDWYLRNNPDIADAGLNPLVHYLTSGWKEDRRPHPLFDPRWYRERYGDVAENGIEPLTHYINSGWREGRNPTHFFDTVAYRRDHSELSDRDFDPFEHFVISGRPIDKLQKGESRPTKLKYCKRKIVRYHHDWDAEVERGFLERLDSASVVTRDVKVSIVMPTRDRADCIGDAISSVLAQTHENWELIIVDDGSLDNTTHVVESYRDNRIKYLPNKVGRGVSAARNQALESATGEWLFFLDSDNRWRPTMLQTMLRFVSLHQLNAAYCAANISTEDGAPNKVLYADFDMESCLRGNFIDLNCFCVRRSASIERFDTTLKRLVDWDFILRIANITPLLGAPFIGVEYYDGPKYQRITRTERTGNKSLEDLMGHVKAKISDRILAGSSAFGHNKSSRIAVVFHVYHKDVVADCIDAIKNIAAPFDLFVTTSHDLDDPVFSEISGEFERVVLLQYPNVGSDIGPFLELVSTLGAYELVCKIHTKRNTDKWGAEWRAALLDSVLGSEDLTNQIIQKFADDPRVLAAGGEAFFKLGDVNSIPETRKQLSDVAQSVGWERYLGSDWSFFAGTMFWIRPKILTKVANVACSKPFFSADFKRDGAVEHAWERILGMSLLQSENGRVLATTPDDGAGFGLIELGTTDGAREGITVTLDRLVAKSRGKVSRLQRPKDRRAKISTVVPTYNQRRFIGFALESAIMQKGSFDHEILVSDDGSTDGAPEIVQEFEHSFRGLVRSIGGAKNRGISQNFRHCFQQASGDYIAVLEGDDYWLVPDKLERQLKFLEENPDCSMVFSKIDVLDVENGTRTPLKRQDQLRKRKLDGSDFLADPNMNLIANFSCCMFRADLLKTAPPVLFDGRINEIAVAFYLEQHGPIGFIDEVMGVYRFHPSGVWSGSDRRAQLESGMKARRTAKSVAKPKYRDAIQTAIDTKFSAPLAKLDGQSNELAAE